MQTLPEKAIDNAVKDNRNWLPACLSANGGNFEHIDCLEHKGDIYLFNLSVHSLKQ